MRSVSLFLVFLLLAGVATASPAGAYTEAARDIDTLSEDDRQNVIYFWVPYKGKQLDNFRVVFKYRINRASKERDFVDPVEVAPNLWRVDISDLGWDRGVLDKTKDTDVYFHRKITVRAADLPAVRMKARRPPARMKKAARKTRQVAAVADWLPARDARYLADQTGAQSPVLYAPWFMFHISRQLSLQNQETGHGIYDILGLKDRAAFFELVGLDEARALRSQREIRAALDVSDLTGTKGRQIFRLPTLQGDVWTTLDTNNPSGRGIAINNLKRGEYAHNAEEHFGHNRNGLVVDFLCSDQGVRQSTAPDFVGQNDAPLNRGVLHKNRDLRIHVGHCASCHDNALKPVKDWVRKNFERPPPGKRGVTVGTKKKQEDREFRRQYLSNLEESLDADIKVHARAVQLATVTRTTPKGLSLKEIAALDMEVLQDYALAPVTLEVAAMELGTTPEKFVRALLDVSTLGGELDLALSAYVKDKPGALSRIIWEDRYALAHDYLRGIVK